MEIADTPDLNDDLEALAKLQVGKCARLVTFRGQQYEPRYEHGNNEITG